jgi:transcriptional regulator with XRE-family HTH domain
MSRRGFTPKDVERSAILRTLSVNLELIRRMEGLTMTKFAKMVGVSDRYLKELIRQETNVSILVLEHIAARLRIPLMTLIASPLEVRIPGAVTGFLRSIQQKSAAQARDMTRESSAEGFRPLLRRPGLLANEQSSLTPLLVSIAHNQLTLSRQLAELDAWMNDNLISDRMSRPDAIQ